MNIELMLHNIQFKPLRSFPSIRSDSPTPRSAVNGFAILSQPHAPQVRRLTGCYTQMTRSS